MQNCMHLAFLPCGLVRVFVLAPARWMARLSEQAHRLESYLLPFEDFLVDDLSSFNDYIQRQLITFIYKFFLLCLVVEFCFSASHTLFARLLFSLAVIHMVFRIKVCLVNYDVDTLKFWGAIDVAVASVLNVVIHYEDVVNYNTNMLLLIIAFLTFSRSITLKVAVTSLAVILNALLPFQSTDGRSRAAHSARDIMVMSFVLIVTHAQNLVNTEFIRRFTHCRQDNTAELHSKDMFVACISHDLKNLLNSLLGSLEMVKNSSTLSEADKENLTTASYSGQILHYLIGNIIDTTRIEAGKFDIDRLPMDIMETINKVAVIEGDLTKKKGVTLYRRFHTRVPRLVYGDSMRFTQVLLNILGNSIKFTSHGYVAMGLRWASSINEIKNAEQAEQREALIPPEEYFMMEGAVDSPRAIGRNRDAFSEDYGENTLEEMQESIQDKIVKYNESPRSKGGRREQTTLFTMESASQCGGAESVRQKRLNGPSRFKNPDPKKRNGAKTATDLRAVATEDHKERYPTNPTNADQNNGGNVYEDQSEITGDSGLLVVDIIDTGIGLTEDEQQRLFKPFNQANSGVRAKYGGTGLGLWITKQLVYLMSGLIELRSQPGKGTRFRIALPFKIVNASEDPGSPHSEEGKGDTATLSGSSTIISMNRVYSRVAAEIRAAGTSSFRASGSAALKRVNVILIEDDKTPVDSQLEQVAEQLKKITCKVTYATYTTALQVLKSGDYKFDAMLILACNSVAGTMKLATTIMKTIKDADYKQIPMVVASGNTTHFSSRFRTICAGRVR